MVRRLSVLAAIAAVIAFPALAQQWPAKPVRLVVPYPPGSFIDVVARLVTPQLTSSLGQPVVVDNRPGAGESLAAEIVARATADGYTLLICSVNGIVFRPNLAKSVAYDPVKDFTPITEAVRGGLAVVVHVAVAAGSLGELIEFAKRNPGRISYGTAGIGSGAHLSGEQLRRIAGIDIVHVPYKSAVQPLQEVMAGQIPMSFLNIGSLMPQMKSGKFRVLAVTGATRNRLLPDVPSFGETLPDFRPIPSWTGVLAPGGLPPALLGRASAEVRKAFNVPEVRAKIESTGFDVVAGTPEEFAASIRRDLMVVRDIVTAARIPPLE